MDAQHYESFFKDQVVFLTGGTGGLGGCLLYKLALKLPTRRIIVLCRSVEKAKASWKQSMPSQLKAILSTGKVTLITGDITLPNFGIQLSRIAQTTIVINAAADISFGASLEDSIRDNCTAPLELARMVSSLKNLRHFIQISSAYCNSFLLDGLVEERIYPLDDAETELKDPIHASKFAWPCSYAKYMMERLLTEQYPNLPLLLVRPTTIGSAVYQPYPLYGPLNSTPLETFFRLFSMSPGNGIFHAPTGSVSGTNIFDEVPVDWVANLILLHAAVGTLGVVHAGAESYVPRTFDEMLASVRRNGGDFKVQFVTDRSLHQCPLAEFYKIGTRDWRFSNKLSERFRSVEGPLSISVKIFDLAEFDRKRFRKVIDDLNMYKAHAKL